MAMDLFRPAFESYFMSKEEVGKKISLDSKKEWVLFVSSFSYANLTESHLSNLEKMDPISRPIAEFSDSSYPQIVDWF